jgi:hypothetical protein
VTEIPPCGHGHSVAHRDERGEGTVTWSRPVPAQDRGLSTVDRKNGRSPTNCNSLICRSRSTVTWSRPGTVTWSRPFCGQPPETATYPRSLGRPVHGNLVAASTDSCGDERGNLVAQSYIRITFILLPVVAAAFLWIIRRRKVAFRKTGARIERKPTLEKRGWACLTVTSHSNLSTLYEPPNGFDLAR